MRASMRNWRLATSPYGTATRSIGAERCTYQPFCKRKGRKSSSLSRPACQRPSWSRNCRARCSTKCLSNAVYWHMESRYRLGARPGGGKPGGAGEDGGECRGLVYGSKLLFLAAVIRIGL